MLKPDHDGRYRLSFLLLPGYSMAALQAAIDPLHLANEITGHALYDWELLSLDHSPVRASNNLSLPAHEYQHCQPSNLFICAGSQPWLHQTPMLLWWLRTLYKHNTVFGAIDTGSMLLADANLLKKGPVCLSLKNADSFRHRYPDIELSREAYELDSHCISCGGGFAASGLMLRLIEQHYNEAIAGKVAAMLNLPENPTAMGEPEVQDRRLRKAITLMQANLEQPLCSTELADKAFVSVRHLERLFKRHLQVSPASYYLKLRLDHARHLIHNSPLEIGTIAGACGFSSRPHFSRSYTRHFGIGPKRDRMERMEAGLDVPSIRSCH